MMQTTEVGNNQQKRLAGTIIPMIANYETARAERERFAVALHESEEHLQAFQKRIGAVQLATGVARHLNNILTALIGCGTQLHMKMDPGDPLRVYVERILSSSERAADMTKKLLAFSGEQRLKPRMADLNATISRAERLLTPYMGKGVKVKMELTDGDLPVMLDAMRFEEGFCNLISNAVDAMPGGGTLTIRTGSLTFGTDLIEADGASALGACALLTIGDTGVGMSRHVKERIFEPFFTTKEIGKGVGLGLPVAYHIIKQHNGSINVNSRPGEGTKVNVYLPLLKAVAEKVQQPIPLFPSYQI